MYYDWNTRNKSFVKVANFLKELGIKNYRFPLVLYDPDLSGVDPYAKDLSEEMRAKILYECSRNKIYFVRELVRIREQGSPDSVMYEAHVGNMTIHFLRSLDINSYLELPRQCGKSIVAAVEFAYIFLFGQNTDMGVYNYNNEMVKTNISRIYGMLNELPPWMHFHKLDVKEDPKNPDAVPLYKIVPMSQTKKLSASMKLRNNNITGKTPGINASQADEAGRGATMLHQWWDEPCATRNFDIAASAAFPAFVTAAEKAKKNGASHSIMITSTPPDIDSKHGQYLNTFVKQDMARWSLSYFDKNKQQLETILKRYSKNSFFYVSFQYQQVFKDEAWYTKQLELVETSAVRREILLIWEKEIVGNPFDVNDIGNLEKAVLSMGHFKQIEVDTDIFFKIYCNSNPYGPGSYKETMTYIFTKRIIIASDVAGGTGGKRDYSTLVGIDPITSDLLFTFRSNTLDPNEFSKLIHKFVTMYCPKGVICMERNSYGRAVLANLRDPDPARGIPDNLLYMPMSASMKSEGAKADRGDKIAGIYTLKEFRERLFLDILSRRLKKHKYMFRSEEIFNELCSLVEKNGRIDHKDGAHDDLLFAFMIGHWVLNDQFHLLLADYPDIGARTIYSDESLDLRINAKDKDPSMETVYECISEFRQYYKDIIDEDKDIIDITQSKKGLPTYQELIHAQNLIIDNNGGKLPENRFHRKTESENPQFDHFAILKEAERINDEARRSRAKELGMSDESYMYIRNHREIHKNQDISFNDKGLPVSNGPSQAETNPQVKARLSNLFGGRR